jgi:uncharacterized protein YceK
MVSRDLWRIGHKRAKGREFSDLVNFYHFGFFSRKLSARRGGWADTPVIVWLTVCEGRTMTVSITVALGVAALLLSGCGTVNSVIRKDGDTARELRLIKTYCQSIPRVYSGVAFDFCSLHAAPDPTGILIPFVLLDIAVSGVADTVVLPYTIYRQASDGNISIYWRPGGS